MVELGIIFLCIGGAVPLTMTTVACIAIGIVALYGLIPSRRTVVAGCMLALLFVGGSWYASYRTAHTFVAPGDGSFLVRVVSVDRQLEKSVIVVRTTNGARIQLHTIRPALLPGDELLLTGDMREPADFSTDTGRIVRYRTYLHNRGIVGIMYDPNIELVAQGSWSVARVATTVRFAIAEIYATYISFPADGITSGMLVGYQGGIPKNIEALFRDTGVLHVLVLSGYNITLFAGLVLALLRPFPYRMRLIGTLLSIAFLVFVSGLGIASVRAGIMGAIGILAGLTLRTYRPFRALMIAVLIFFVLSPGTVQHDAGFHLSVLATFCMIMVVPKVGAVFRFIPQTRWIDLRELVSLAIIMPIWILPYMMHFSGTAPLAALPANVVLAIVAPVVMIGGGALLLVSWVDPIAHIIGEAIGILLACTLWMLRLFAQLPLWNTPPIDGWSVVVIYAVLSIALFRTELMGALWQLRSSLARHPSSSERGSP